jgi:aspartate dehydrogenase
MMKVGLVGCGNIGADLCIALRKGTIPAKFVALTDLDPSPARSLMRAFQLDATVCELDECAAMSDCLIECAGGDVVKDVVEAAIHHRIDCMIMSVGGLMAHPDLYERAQMSGRRIYIPCGALCGLDGIRSAMEAGLHHVTLTTRKPPRGLEGAPFLVENDINLSDLTAAKLVFEGTAEEAVKAFPKNVNVAASLSFAGIGPKETIVRIIADPMATCNSHEVVAEGAFGRLTTLTENLPSPRNAKSSYLASLSACAELRTISETFASRRLKVGKIVSYG